MPTDFIHSLEFLQQLRSLHNGGKTQLKVAVLEGAVLLLDTSCKTHEMCLLSIHIRVMKIGLECRYYWLHYMVYSSTGDVVVLVVWVALVVMVLRWHW
jgi:hypothetical protein